MGYGGWGITIYMHASCRLLYPGYCLLCLLYPGYFACCTRGTACCTRGTCLLYPGYSLTRCTGPNISASTRSFLSHRPELPSPHHGTSSTPQGST